MKKSNTRSTNTKSSVSQSTSQTPSTRYHNFTFQCPLVLGWRDFFPN